MPNCPKCNTWNPDDKTYCWRCQAEMPKPVPKKVKRTATIAGIPVWMWLLLLLFFVSLFLGQCYMLGAPQG